MSLGLPVGVIFKSLRFRQRELISLYLFVISMEALSCSLAKLQDNLNFGQHQRCKVNNITHLCFTDDLILFCRVDKDSVRLITTTLDAFYSWFELQANPSKSNMYFSGVNHEVKWQPLSILGYKEGDIPFKYLGVSLCLRKLNTYDCKPLVEKIMSKVTSQRS